jgi:MSHA pilin protein MshD
MTKPRQRGFTLIELIIFIVVVSAGLAGILSVMNTVVKSSADPMVRKQAMALADSILEEILLKSYCDPDTVDTSTTPPTCGANTVEAGRSTYDDVDDYNGKTNADFTDLPADLAGYVIGIAVVADTTTLGVPAKKVTVTITHDGTGAVSMTGYRTNY